MLNYFSLLAYGSDSRPPMAIFELLDYIVNEVSVVNITTPRHKESTCILVYTVLMPLLVI